ncbi:hypothetical protein ACIBK8_26060 [Streptomyces sp. NPDC050161]|uniref:hypothetical protein n=1 Tax=Streptomyces sp. NPDC050161 TaxID=3365604 RepID=UPI003796EA0C
MSGVFLFMPVVPPRGAARARRREMTGELTMARDGSAERDDRPAGDGPWWAGTGPVGAVGLIVAGAGLGLWFTLRLPGTPDEPGTASYGAAKILAIGLVLAGTALMGRLRARAGGKRQGEGE